MNASPTFEAHAPEGYFTHEAKQKYQVWVGVAAGLTIAVQMLLPMLILLPAMFASALESGFEITMPAVDRCAYWKNHVWVPEESLGPGQSSGLTLFGLNLDDEKARREIALDMSSPALLPGDDRLWLVSTEAVGYLKDGEVTIERPLMPLQDVSRPFFHQGRPSVIGNDATGYALWSFADGEWQRVGGVDLDGAQLQRFVLADVQVVNSHDGLHFFLRKGGTLYYRNDLEIVHEEADSPAQTGEPSPPDDNGAAQMSATEADSGKWSPVAVVGYEWYAIEMVGQPVVFHRKEVGPRSQIIGLERDAGRWEQCFAIELGLVTAAGVCALDESGQMGVLTQGVFGALRLREFHDSKLVAERKYGGEMPMFGGSDFFWAMTIFPQVVTVVTTLIFAGVLSWLIAAHRDQRFYSAVGPLPFASLWRRAAALLVDGAIISLPAAPVGWWIYAEFDFEQMFDPQQFAPVIGWLSAFIVWGLSWFFVLSFTEGRLGCTPGKWLLGIRVVSTDLRPCGFGLGVVRRLLLLVDSLFQFMVGLLVLAYTAKLQRLGDLAAGTVVLKAAPLRDLRAAE